MHRPLFITVNGVHYVLADLSTNMNEVFAVMDKAKKDDVDLSSLIQFGRWLREHDQNKIILYIKGLPPGKFKILVDAYNTSRSIAPINIPSRRRMTIRDRIVERNDPNGPTQILQPPVTRPYKKPDPVRVRTR